MVSLPIGPFPIPVYTFSQQNPATTSTTSTTTTISNAATKTTAINEVNKTSGGITIVKLNAAPPLPAHQPIGQSNQLSNGHPTSSTATLLRSHHQHHHHHQPQQPKLNGLASHTEHQTAPVAPPRPTTPSQILGGHHVVTIHTSSVTAASATAGTSQPATIAPAAAQSTPPTHTGYTRRAKLGDSRSTGRLHSAGNTHRSMTRLNIAGKKCQNYIDYRVLFLQALTLRSLFRWISWRSPQEYDTPELFTTDQSEHSKCGRFTNNWFNGYSNNTFQWKYYTKFGTVNNGRNISQLCNARSTTQQ